MTKNDLGSQLNQRLCLYMFKQNMSIYIKYIGAFASQNYYKMVFL